MASRKTQRREASKPPQTVEQESALGGPSTSGVTVTYEERTFQWSGPLPPAVELRAYDDLVTGGAERIFRQFEVEAEHRRSLEAKSIIGGIDHNKRAQLLAGAFAFGALGVGAYAIYFGAFTVAGIVLGTTLVGVIGAFLYREARSRAE